MSKLPPLPHWCESGSPFAEQMQAYATAATEPLLQRIAELEKALKLVQQHHATAWNRGHIAGMAANRMVAQDALNAVKKDAWNNTQLTEALMAAESRCEELERQLEDVRKDAEPVRRMKQRADELIAAFENAPDGKALDMQKVQS